MLTVKLSGCAFVIFRPESLDGGYLGSSSNTQRRRNWPPQLNSGRMACAESREHSVENRQHGFADAH